MAIESVSGTVNQLLRSAEGRTETSSVRQKTIQGQSRSAPIADNNTKATQNEPERKQVDRVVESLNELANSLQRRIEFSIDDNTGRTVITIVDQESDRVIRQIPPEELMRLAAHLQETQGLIINSEV